MADRVTGSFSGTGQSATIVARKIDVKMDFSGTATVQIETQMPSGAWIVVGTAFTADTSQVVEFASRGAVRLNCTAYTNSVEYSMTSESL